MSIVDDLNAVIRRTDLTRKEKIDAQDRLLADHHRKCCEGFAKLERDPAKVERKASNTTAGVTYVAGGLRT